MEWLNYHHLQYFWVVAREGGLVPAGRVLRLSHSTLSASIKSLEARLGASLFVKEGRRLALTETGRLVQRYADEIFKLGLEMTDAVADRSGGRGIRLEVGVADAVPKLVARRLLAPALSLPDPVRLVCREGSDDRLLADLAIHALDVVLSDSPVPSGSTVRAFHHLLGETGITFFAAPGVALRHGDFPRSLDGAPMLLPLEGLALRRSLGRWLDRHGLRPRVVAEIADSALLETLGGDGAGVFAAPTAIEDEIAARHGVAAIGRTDEVRARYYAITVERRLRHPAVVAISEAAHGELSGTVAARTSVTPRPTPS